MEIKGKYIHFDEQGFMQNANDWNEDIAVYLASQENITLCEEHWQIIHFTRKFYAEFGYIPQLRVFVKALKNQFGGDIGNSLYLYRLFPDGPLKQICKIAGLPKPKHCL